MRTITFLTLLILSSSLVLAITWGSIAGGDNAEVTLQSPADNHITQTPTVTFSCLADINGSENVQNVSLYHNVSGTWTLNSTYDLARQFFQRINDSQTNPVETDMRGIYIYTHENLTLRNVTLAPNSNATTVYLQNAGGGAIASATAINQNASFNQQLDANTSYRIVADRGGAIYTDDRITVYTFPENRQAFNYTTGVAGGTNSSTFYNILGITVGRNVSTTEQNFTIPVSAPLTWNCEACANDNTCGLASSNRTIIGGIANEEYTFNSTTYETATETYTLNITHFGGLSFNGAQLNYSNIFTTATSTEESATNRILTATFTPNTTLAGSNTFNFNYSLGGTAIGSTAQTQSVTNAYLVLCNATFSTIYFNLTFQDEVNLTVLNASIPTSTFIYSLSGGIANKTYTFSDTDKNIEYNFCFSPENRSVDIDYRIQAESDSYPQRVIDPVLSTFLNTTTHRVMYLLHTSDGIYVTFQVINVAENPLENTLITVRKTISSVSTLVAEGLTSAAGSLTFWLDPDSIHDFSFSRSGYTTESSSFAPSLTEYTIVLGGSTSSSGEDLSRGVTYTFNPLGNTLFNATTYTFNFTLASSYHTIDEFGFILKNSSGDVLGSDSSAAGSGTVTVNANTSNYNLISMEAYWEVDGEYLNVTKNWYVISSAGTSWSIANFFTDLTSYVNAGMFGITNLGFVILLFFTTLGFVGMLSMKFGIRSPEIIIGVIFSIVLLMDVGLGLLDEINPVGVISNFPTILVGAITLGYLMWRWR